MNLRIFRRSAAAIRQLLFLIITLSVPMSSGICSGAEQAFLVTYGNAAGTIEGDDDFLQVIFIRIPDARKDPLYIRIFDPDCGGSFDARYGGKWDTVTSFRLFGGKGAYSNPGLKKMTPEKHDLTSGNLLTGIRFKEDKTIDNTWYSFQPVQPEEGEKIDGYRYFKLVIEGVEGDDGNRYLIDASADPDGRQKYSGAEMFAYAVTVNLSRPGVFAEMRFFAPKDISRVIVHNFDLAGATVKLDTAFRTSLPVRTSGQNQWVSDAVRLDKKETGRLCALRFEGGDEMPNDASFYVTDADGNILPIQIPVFLWKYNARPEPHVKFTVSEDCVTVLFDASGSKDHDREILKFFWDFGDGSTGEGVRVSHAYSSPGTYRGHLIAEDTSGHVSSSALKPFSVTINQPPVANAGPDRIAAPGEVIEFNASESFDPDGNIIRYVWDFGDNKPAAGQIVRRRFDQPGTYPVTLKVEDNSGSPCSAAEDGCEVVINAAPEPAISVDLFEGRPAASVGETVRFSGKNSRDPDGTVTSFVWNFGDGVEKTGETVDHQYEKPGVFQVTLTVTDDSGVKNNSASARVSVVVNDPPVADAGKELKASAGEPVLFDASKSHDRDGAVTEVLWDFGDGSTRLLPCDPKDQTCMKPVHVYDAPGTYTASVAVRDNSGSTSDTAAAETTVVVNAPPVARAGDDQLTTSGQVQFDGTASADPDGRIIHYRWDFGDGASGDGPSPVHVYRNHGQFTVTLTVTDDSGTSSDKSSDELTVTVNQMPVADAGPDRVGIPGKPVRFDGSGSVDPDGHITSWRWDFGDGTRADSAEAEHIYQQPGVYAAQLTVSDNSGHEDAVGYDTAIVVINAPPVAIAGPDAALCPGDRITFDGTRSYDPDGTVISHRWVFSDGVTSDAAKTERRFDRPGLFTGVLTVADNRQLENSTAQSSLKIRVNHPPVANAGQDIHTSDRTVFFDGSGSRDADGDPLIHHWNFGDGAEAVGETASHTYAKGGVYPVILTADDTQGLKNSVSKDSLTVRINEPPIADAGSGKITCAGKVVLFDGSGSRDPEGGVMKYDWDFGDGSSAQGINPVKIYDAGGIYSVILTVTDDSGIDGGNKGMDQVAVRVIESPVANAGSDITVCAGSAAQFDGTQSKDIDGLVNSYRWDFGDGGTGGGPTPVHVYAKPGVYRVRLTITGDRTDVCDNVDTDELIVTVENAPVSDFLSPATAEIGKPVVFEAVKDDASLISIMKWDWDFGDDAYGQGKKVTHVFPNHGQFIVTLTVTSDSETECNKTSIQKSIRVNAPPVAKAGTDPMTHLLVAVNEPVLFDGHLSRDPDGAIVSYVWDFGDGNTSEGIQVRHKYRIPGQYGVELRVTDDTDLGNNTGADTMLVTVNNPPNPVISVKDNICPGEPVDISGRDSSDGDGEIMSYTWNFGDGSEKASGRDVRHVYRRPGTYVILLEADDGRAVGNSRVQTSRIITVNAPPVADAGPDRIIALDEEITADGSLSYDRDGTILLWKWDFGDGTTKEGQKTFHRYQTPGVYTLRLTVQDDSEASCSQSEDSAVIRVNSPPVAAAGKDRDVFFGGANDSVVFDASESFDPDGDPLTFQWDFGDGNRASGVKVRHRYHKPGKYRVTLKADDGTGTKTAVSVSTVTVHVKKR